MKLAEALKEMPAPPWAAVNRSGAHILIVQRNAAKLDLLMKADKKPAVVVRAFDGVEELEKFLKDSRDTGPQVANSQQYSIEGYNPGDWEEPAPIQPTDSNDKPIQARMMR